MNFPDFNLLNSWISALGWSLVHFLWQGCVIAAGYWLLCALSRPGSAALRYWSGLAAYVASVGVLISTFRSYYRPAAEFAEMVPAPRPAHGWVVLSGGIPNLGSSLQAGLEPLMPYVVAGWLAGMMVLWLRTAMGWLGARRLVNRGTAPVSATLQGSVNGLRECLAVRQAVTVLQSTRAKVPMVIGWLRPIILLPACIANRLPREQLEMVIAHELGHIKRLDYLFNLFQIAVETALFYHPAVRWIGIRIRQEREVCCDDLVVAHCGRPVTYARALANLEMSRSPAGLMAMAATGTNRGGDLLARIRRIVDRDLKGAGSGYARLLLLAVIGGSVAVGARPGLDVQRALRDVAEQVQLQVSDFEDRMRGRSHRVWADGIARLLMQEAFALPARGVPSGVPRPEPDRADPVALHAEKTVVRKKGPARHPLPARLLEEPRSGPEFAPALPPVAAKSDSVPADTQPGAVIPASRAEKAAPETVVYEPRRTVAPRYPWRARRHGVEGFVELEFGLDSEGRVRDIEVVDAFPPGVFERTAIRALKKWQYEAPDSPGEQRRLRKAFDFELQGQAEELARSRFCGSGGRRACRLIPTNAVVLYVNPPQARRALAEN